MRGRVALVIGVLGLALVALLIEFKRVLQRPRHTGSLAPLAEGDNPPPEHQPDTPPPLRLPGRVPLLAHRPQAIGLAHLHGRLVKPATDEDDIQVGKLSVVADDGRRTFDARIVPGEAGRFEMHVPPGRYTLTARAGDLVGGERDVVLEAGSERDVLVYLEGAVAIAGDVRASGAAADESLFALAFRAGTKIEQGDGTVDGGRFSIDGLRSGETYDLVFGGNRARTVTLHNVTAPAKGLEINLAPLPIVRGAIGFARGAACPFRSVAIQKPGAVSKDDEEDQSSVELEADCRFELPIPEDAPAVMVVARGLGWYTEAQVVVPPIGDPDPICLNPPCRADPLEGTADLFVSLDLPAERAANAYIRATVQGQTCAARGTSCEIRGLPAGDPVTVSVSANYGECGETRTAALSAGVNSISVACVDPAQSRLEPLARRVQGVLHTAAGDTVDRIAIRCNGAGSERTLSGTHVFAIACPRDASTLEYQVTPDGPWTAVSIPDRPDLALVEIAVGQI